MREATPSVWWARLGLVVGFSSSLAANLMSATTAESRVISAMFPIILALAMEILFRVEWERKLTHFGLGLGFVGIAGGAALGSASHIYEVAMEQGGQSPPLAVALVVAVDGLMLMSTITLVEAQHRPEPEPVEVLAAPTEPVVEAPAEPEPAPEPEPVASGEPEALRPVPDLVEDPQTEARRLRDEGLTQQQIADQLGKSVRTIRRYLAADEVAA